MMIKMMLMSDCGNIDSNIDIDDDGQVCRQTQTDDDNGPGENDSDSRDHDDSQDHDAQNNFRFAENRQTQLGVERFRIWAKELQLQANNLEL